MKTAPLFPILHHVDTAPLAARYEVMMASIMAFIEAGRLGEMLRYSHKVVRLVRVFTKLETQNALLKRKLDMLSHKPWRELVLKELGGVRKLKLWEAAQKRIKQRIENRAATLVKTMPQQEPAWLYTPERRAESERLKARKRMCGRATAHPRIFRDRCKMDCDGLFRLAPLSRGGPRGERAARQMKVYTQNTIIDYEWNNIPFGMESPLGPAMVWPVEFYAAAAIEAEILEGAKPTLNKPLIPAQRFEKNARAGTRSDDWVPNQVRHERNNKRSIPLTQILSPKVYQDIFGSLTR